MFDLGVNSFGSEVKPALGQVDPKIFVVYTNEEKVDFRKYMPMMAFVRVRVETQPDCTGAGKTPAVCMGVVDILYV